VWALTNRTPYAAERTWTRDKTGAHHWLVAVKATFSVVDNRKPSLADEQMPPLLAAEYVGEPGKSSLRYEADLTLLKPTTDVIVNGRAHAPRGKPTRHVLVGLRLGTIGKVLLVHGTRVYYSGPFGITPCPAVPFVTQPISYERAFGGTDTKDPDPKRHACDLRNPIGRGFAVRSRSLIHQPAFNVQYPGGNASKVGPAGFGAIASYWSPRLELAGTYDARWEKSNRPLLAENYDERFVQCAPTDQRPARRLRGGELVGLMNLTPEGRLRFALPEARPRCRTFFGKRKEEHDCHLSTVIIEPDHRRLLLVWQADLPVAVRDIDHLDETVVEEAGA
jgi:hypothetical protein